MSGSPSDSQHHGTRGLPKTTDLFELRAIIGTYWQVAFLLIDGHALSVEKQADGGNFNPKGCQQVLCITQLITCEGREIVRISQDQRDAGFAGVDCFRLILRALSCRDFG